jgi:hypothetical protein
MRETIFTAGSDTQGKQLPFNEGRQLQRTQSASVAREPNPPQDPIKLKRIKSENPRALRQLKRRSSSFRQGGSKYLNSEDGLSAPTRRTSRTIFADELGCELEEVCINLRGVVAKRQSINEWLLLTSCPYPLLFSVPSLSFSVPRSRYTPLLLEIAPYVGTELL